MKKHMTDLLKGIVIGIGSIAPGLSGGVMAIILNEYDRIIDGSQNILRHPLKVIKEMWGLIVGILIGAAITFIGIIKLIELFPIPMMMLFIGFIIGTVPHLYEKVKHEKKNVIDYIIFFVMISIIVGFSLVKGDTGSYNTLSPIALFFVGVVIASTILIPGISVTAVLMVMGVFVYLVNMINGFIDVGLTFNIKLIFSEAITFIPLVIGFVLGLVLFAKALSKLFAKYEKTMNIAIIGLFVASPFTIIWTMLIDYQEQMQKQVFLNVIVGVVLLVIGAILSIYLAGFEKKNEQMQN